MNRRNFMVLAGLVAVVAGTAAAAEGDSAMGQLLLQPQIGTMFWTLLTFGIMLLILRRVAWSPLLGALDARQRSIEDSIGQARKDREQAQALLQQQQQLLTEARRERVGALEEGRRDAERVKQEILDQARKEREQVLRQTQDQIEAGLREAREGLRATATELAILAAEKLLAKSLDDATHRRLIEDYLVELERSAGGSSSLPS